MRLWLLQDHSNGSVAFDAFFQVEGSGQLSSSCTCWRGVPTLLSCKAMMLLSQMEVEDVEGPLSISTSYSLPAVIICDMCTTGHLRWV